MGRLIVLEGLDGCGKSTQLQRLDEYLESTGKPYRQISFPDYGQPSSALVREYLAGSYGSKPGDVNAYAASSFFAVDRYVSYNCYWKEKYLSGEVFLADRYTTSNAYHQLTKTDRAEWDAYLEWLEDFEYNKLGIPKPDAVIYLDMPIEVSQKLMSGRYKGDESKKDIHEKDVEYLNSCRVAADYACTKLGWKRINCSENGEPLPIEVISEAVLNAVIESLGL